MKTQLLALSFALISAQVASAQSSPKVAFGPQPYMFTGTAPQGSKISAIFFLSPDKASLAQKKCEFPEDAYSPNGKDRVIAVNAKIANGQYELDYSTTGVRGECQYVLTEIDLTIAGKNIFEDMTIVPQAFAPQDEYELVAPVQDASPMYCDTSVGWCQSDKNSQKYSFGPQEKKITIDFKDISEKPADPDSYSGVDSGGQ